MLAAIAASWRLVEVRFGPFGLNKIAQSEIDLLDGSYVFRRRFSLPFAPPSTKTPWFSSQEGDFRRRNDLSFMLENEKQNKTVCLVGWKALSAFLSNRQFLLL
jgi:hypothetical protein